jgi:hypothetical protein
MKGLRQEHLRLESLEERTLLSTCHVTRLGDFGAGATMGEFSRGDLRFCINHAKANPGPDTIDFSASGTIILSSALPDLEGELMINGPGAHLLTIDANQKTRVFYVAAGANVRISGLTATGGKAPLEIGTTNYYPGGGIYNAGTLSLENCSILRNMVTGGWFGDGGGVYNRGTLWLSNCVVSENVVDSYFSTGGGIYNEIGATLFVQGTAISSNRCLGGFSGWTKGAGIANRGNAAVIDSTVLANTANGRETFGGRGGGIFNEYTGELIVRNSLIRNNSVLEDIGSFGGGIANNGGKATIINSTVTENTVTCPNHPTGSGDGGGIFNDNGGTIVVSHSTISHNRAKDMGGGIRNNSNGSLRMDNTIVANNHAGYLGSDLRGSLTNSGYNLVGTTVGGSGYASSDILDVDPILGPLQDNGGLTWTMALLPGSPAIDAGDPSPLDAPLWDQRGPGFPRLVNGHLDIGAFEVQATGVPGTDNHLAFLITADLDSKDSNWRN